MEKTIQQLDLKDDFLFAKVMGDREICRKVLGKILGSHIREIGEPITQKAIDILLESKGVRLDVYVSDDEGTVYNAEMQRKRQKGLPRRMRYYQGSIDLDLISSGGDYRDMKQSFVIFICSFDPYGQGRHLYTFENLCHEDTSIAFGDGTTKIILNTKGTVRDVDDDMLELLAYVEDSSDAFAEQAKSPLIKEIHRKVTEVKQSKEMEAEYMTLFLRDRENIERGREEGLAEGRAEGRESATKILKCHIKGMTTADIASSLRLDREYVDAVISDFLSEA